MSLVPNATCCTPAPWCQARKSSIWPGRRLMSGSMNVNVTPPEGLCTTLLRMPCSPTSMYSSNVTAKPNARSCRAIVASSSPTGTHTAAWSMTRSSPSSAAASASGTISIAPGRKLVSAPWRSTRRYTTSPKPATSAVTTEVAPSAQVRGLLRPVPPPSTASLNAAAASSVLNAVTAAPSPCVATNRLGGWMVGLQARGQQYPDVVLSEQPAALPRQPCLCPAVPVNTEAVSGAQILCRLTRITHIELDVVHVEDIHRLLPLQLHVVLVTRMAAARSLSPSVPPGSTHTTSAWSASASPISAAAMSSPAPSPPTHTIGPVSRHRAAR